MPVPFEDEQALREIRGAEIAMIFQDPQAALTPMLRIGDQVAEVFSAHGVEKREAYERGIEVLGRFLPRPRDVAKLFSHQLSGGMAQRVMIAMATALQPRVIIADEPTASLDVAIRDTTLTFLEELRDNQDVAVLLITHDFGVVARLADRVAVVYAGEVVEATEVRTIFRAPKHPYTYGLLSSLPGPASPGPPAAAAARPAAGPRRPARGVPVPRALPQGDHAVPDRAGAAAVDGGAGPPRGVLQPDGGPAARRLTGPRFTLIAPRRFETAWGWRLVNQTKRGRAEWSPTGRIARERVTTGSTSCTLGANDATACSASSLVSILRSTRRPAGCSRTNRIGSAVCGKYAFT